MTPEYVIIHHSNTEDSKTLSWGAIRRYHIAKRYNDVGYHFGIEYVRDGYEILVGRFTDRTGAHCRPNKMNHKSIGILLVGNFNLIEPPVLQWNMAIKLVNNLIKQFNIPVGRVLGHKEADHRSCPGKFFDMNEFRKELKCH